MIQVGKHRARAIDATLGNTSTGKEQIGVLFELLDFDPVEHITWYGYFTDLAFPITMRGLRTAGFQGDDFADLSSLRRDDTPEVLLVVEHETYNGTVRAKVKFINSANGIGMSNPLDQAQAQSFAERMRGRVLAFDQSADAPQPAQNPPAKPPARPPQRGNGRPAQRTVAGPRDDVPPPSEPPGGYAEDDIPF